MDPEGVRVMQQLPRRPAKGSITIVPSVLYDVIAYQGPPWKPLAQRVLLRQVPMATARNVVDILIKEADGQWGYMVK
jgi:hypothetical protein